MQLTRGLSSEFDHLRKMDLRDVLCLLEEIRREAEKVLRLERNREPFDSLVGIFGQLDRELLHDLPDQRNSRFDLPMRNALRVRMNAGNARHQVREVPHVREELAYLFCAGLHFKVNAVPGLYCEHL